MAFSRLVFTVLLLSVSCYGTNVPVYLWGDSAKTSGSNPLLAVKSAEFSKLLENEVADASLTVVFGEQNLSVEDFSLKNAEGETVLSYLHSIIGHAKYLASVEDPLVTLEGLAGPDVDRMWLTENGLSADIEQAGKFMFISLEDAREGESRADMLLRHNNFMKDMFSSLKERYGNVVGVYTARNPSWVVSDAHSRVRRQTEQSNNGKDFMFDGLRMYVKSIHIKDDTNIIHLNGQPTATTTFNGTTMNTTLTYPDQSIILNFKQAGGYWFFDTVTVNPNGDRKDLQPIMDVYALMDFSYRCADNVTFTSANSTQSLSIEDLKIQPFFKTTNETENFGDSFNCVGFFSAPIWSGLFVVFILLSITFYGIMMMMDIRTMDRFDDPKGKTITINAGE